MTAFKAGTILALGALGVAAVVEVSAAHIRRIVTDPSQGSKFIRIASFGQNRDGEYVDFDAGGFAAHPGRLSIRADSGGDLVHLGLPERAPVFPARIRRQVEVGDTSTLKEAGKGRLSGHLGDTPLSFGLNYSSEQVEGFPAWLVPPVEGGKTNVWAIHVHGLGSSRSQVLRGLTIFASMGFTSLVPSYDTSLDQGTAAATVSRLGLTEWKAVAAAQRYALMSGATHIVYVGWSLGASIVLRVIASSPSNTVAGAVLVSPALDWREIILRALTSARVPSVAAEVLFARFNKVRRPEEPEIPWDEMPGSPGAGLPGLPILVFHGKHDRSVPVQLTREFALRHREKVSLVEFDQAHHTLEWNAEPDLWESSVKAWCARLDLKFQGLNAHNYLGGGSHNDQ